MDLNLTEKTALVAGSSRGIGKAIARGFLENGSNVIVSGRNADSLEETVNEFGTEFTFERIMSFHGDLSISEDISQIIEKTVKRFGGLDILVANIGSGRGNPGWDTDPAESSQLFKTNFWNSVNIVQSAVSILLKAGRGSIILISSIVGIESTPAPMAYSAAKAALINYSKNLARQLGPSGIRVNCVAPGNIFFPGGSWERKLEENREKFEDYIQTEVPLQRFGKPEEIADLVVFLASDRASFVTGACLIADGGQTRTV